MDVSNVESYLKGKSARKTAAKFLLKPDIYLEGILAEHFDHAEHHHKMDVRDIGSDIVDWETDGPWLQKILEKKGIDVNEVRRRTKPAPLPPLSPE